MRITLKSDDTLPGKRYAHGIKLNNLHTEKYGRALRNPGVCAYPEMERLLYD